MAISNYGVGRIPEGNEHLEIAIKNRRGFPTPDNAIFSAFQHLVDAAITGEKEQALLDFISEIRFDRVGAFQFSFEPGTYSEALGDPIPAEIKQERFERLMKLQQPISLERNQALVGKTLPVLIEGQGDGIAVGRSYRDAPEIDGMVVIEGAAPIGDIIPVRITGAMTYDLTGSLAQTNLISLSPESEILTTIN